MMTGERVGVGHDPQRGAAYVENWVKVLEEDPREIHRAAGEAQRMSDYLIDRAIDSRARSAGQGDRRTAELTQKYSHAKGTADQPHAQTTHRTTRSNEHQREHAGTSL